MNFFQFLFFQCVEPRSLPGTSAGYTRGDVHRLSGYAVSWRVRRSDRRPGWPPEAARGEVGAARAGRFQLAEPDLLAEELDPVAPDFRALDLLRLDFLPAGQSPPSTRRFANYYLP